MSLRILPVRTPTLPPATHTNCYVLDERVVVDAASPYVDEQERLAQELAGAPLQALFLTHHHHDHIGGVERLARDRALPVWAHRFTDQRVAFTVDRHLDEGDLVQGWQALHTPGHATGHLCLWKAETRELIGGDMVASVGTIVLEPPEGELQAYLDNLRRLADLEPEVLYPAHGEPIREPVVLLEHYIAHRHRRTDQIRSALAAGPQSPLEIVAQVYGATIPRAVYPLAARQVTCHLLWLQERGEVERDEEVWRGR